jgi:hypothetical protein
MSRKVEIRGLRISMDLRHQRLAKMDPLLLLCVAHGDGIKPRIRPERKDSEGDFMQQAIEHVMAVLSTCDVWQLTVCYGEYGFEIFWKCFMSGKAIPRIIDMRCVTFESIEDIEKLSKKTWESDLYVRFHFYSCMVNNGEGETKSVSEAIKENESFLNFDRRVEVGGWKGSREVVFGANTRFPGRPEGECELFLTRLKNFSEEREKYTVKELIEAGIVHEADLSLLKKDEVSEVERRSITTCTIAAGIGSRFAGSSACVAKAAAAAEEAMSMRARKKLRIK